MQVNYEQDLMFEYIWKIDKNIRPKDYLSLNEDKNVCGTAAARDPSPKTASISVSNWSVQE